MLDLSQGGWHAAPRQEVAERLQTDANDGLTSEDAGRRLETHGPNQLAQTRSWVRLRRLGNQFRDALVWLLIVAAVISGLVLDAWVDAGAIAVIVILNAAIGYAQEARANTALDRLRQMEAPRASVLRDGVVAEIPARDLVPGDVLMLEAGDLVAADARVSAGVRLIVNEAPLTGESIPVPKDEDPAPSDTVLAERSSMLYAGTTVVSGRGRGIVTATGMGTEMGRIAGLFSEDQPKTPLETDLARIGRRLAAVAGLAAVLIFGAGLARSFPVETMALTAVALAVAAIPEGLPAVITVSLAGGLQRMAQQNAIVRRLPAVETLGAVDVICTDKTGTLTAPELEVGEWWRTDEPDGPLADDSSPDDWLTAAAALCNNAYRARSGWEGDPTETALLESLESQGVDIAGLNTRLPRVDEAGFNGRRKRMSTVSRDRDGYVLLVKGAPEVVAGRSTSVASASGVIPFAEDRRTKVLERAEAMAHRGLRTLALAMKRMEGRPEDPAEEEDDLILLGLVGLREKIRPEVPSAVERARRAGVRTVMVTGDHATTAGAIADSVGIGNRGLMEGGALSRIDVDELTETITDHQVFARVDPADKVKIIEAWQQAGAKVAMTGDGVNDAPALHRADIGVAMGSGTDVARESAAMVLTDDNYATIVEAVAEGRRLFSSLRNVVHYLLSANASEVLFVLTGFLAFGFMGEPLLAVQLLWINLVSDALPAIALGMEAPTRDLMRDPPGMGRDVLGAANMTMLIIQGLILAAAAVGSLLVGTYLMGLEHGAVQTMVFCTLVFSQLLHAMSIRARAAVPTTGRRTMPSAFLVIAILGSAALQLLVVYTGVGNTIFRTVPLEGAAMTAAMGLSLASMVLVRLLDRPRPGPGNAAR
jgi:Ca2+-transporting ATPase